MRNLKEKSRAEFDWLSKYYDMLFGRAFFQTFYRRLESEIDDLGGKSVLSVGSGTAALEIQLAKKFPNANIVCLDLSSKMCEVARNKSAHLKNITFIEGDVEQLPFDEAVFDVIICSHSFHHYPHPLKALQEMKRVLASNGTLFLIDALKDRWQDRMWVWFIEHILEPGVKHYSSIKLGSLFQEADFQRVTVKRINKIGVGYGLVIGR